MDKKHMPKIIEYLLIFLLGSLTTFCIVRFYSDDKAINVTENITKTTKEVTVTDKGIADAVEKVYNAVVVVSTYKDDSLKASGTGFIYKNVGNKYYILTNNHVIEDGNKVTVTFTDQTVLETTVEGSNEYSDIAVLSIESKKELEIATLGNSESIRVGDTSFAVGAPLDNAYSWTVTRGIISGKDRMVEVSLNGSTTYDYVMKVMQTDAAINSGNSGGPLCNSNGEVVGITSLKLVRSGVEGMGFAIPIEDALLTAERIMNKEVIEYPYIGVSMLDVSSAYYSYKYYDIIKKANVTKGVLVKEVEKNSPADNAGLKENDIIVGLSDKQINNVAFLRYYLFEHKVGDTIKLTIYRDGKKQEVNVTLAKNKQNEKK